MRRPLLLLLAYLILSWPMGSLIRHPLDGPGLTESVADQVGGLLALLLAIGWVTVGLLLVAGLLELLLTGEVRNLGRVAPGLARIAFGAGALVLATSGPAWAQPENPSLPSLSSASGLVEPGQSLTSLTGLQLPDRPTHAPPAEERPEPRQEARDRFVVVSSGDTLWELSDVHLGDARLWPQLYDVNRERIGANPDHLEPGLRLTLPNNGTTGANR